MNPRNPLEEDFAALQGCLVEGDPEQQARQRRVRGRSIALSVLLQAAALIAVVLVPMFAKTERIALANVTPVPPYSPYREAVNRQAGPRDRGTKDSCHFCLPTISMHPHEPGEDSGEPNFPGVIPEGSTLPGIIPLTDRRPRRPDGGPIEQQRPRTVHVTNIDRAMLRYRVEPVYPRLMEQIHREGRVEIHAIIGADGTIQAIQAVGGDPMFYASALDAVQQWIYKPTYLNGQPVQVDTTITVIYSMQH